MCLVKRIAYHLDSYIRSINIEAQERGILFCFYRCDVYIIIITLRWATSHKLTIHTPVNNPKILRISLQLYAKIITEIKSTIFFLHT